MAVWNLREPPPSPSCGEGGAICEAGLPGAVGQLLQQPPPKVFEKMSLVSADEDIHGAQK